MRWATVSALILLQGCVTRQFARQEYLRGRVEVLEEIIAKQKAEGCTGPLKLTPGTFWYEVPN